MNREGFWYSKHAPDLPMPKPSPKWDNTEFLAKLSALEDSIMVPYLAACVRANEAYDAAYKQRERERIGNPKLTYSVPYNFPVEERVLSYRGLSGCRLCEQLNGSREFHVDDWEWPAGFRHYVEVHNVKPSFAFQMFIMDKTL